MSEEEIEAFEADAELALYREYRDVLPMFTYVIETDKRFYLANGVKVDQHRDGSDTYFEVTLTDAWVWDLYRQNRFVPLVRVVSYEDVNIEELRRDDAPAAGSGG